MVTRQILEVDGVICSFRLRMDVSPLLTASSRWVLLRAATLSIKLILVGAHAPRIPAQALNEIEFWRAELEACLPPQLSAGRGYYW